MRSIGMHKKAQKETDPTGKTLGEDGAKMDNGKIDLLTVYLIPIRCMVFILYYSVLTNHRHFIAVPFTGVKQALTSGTVYFLKVVLNTQCTMFIRNLIVR